MNAESIERRVIDHITAELLIDEEHQLSADDQLLLDGLIDSIGATRLVAFIEETWGVRVPAADVVVENFGSVKQIVAYIRAADVSSGVE